MHPDFHVLSESWELTLEADNYSSNTLAAYTQALRNLSAWMAEKNPQVGPTEMTRVHLRGWVVHLRDTTSQNTARGWFAGVRHFCRWMVAEGETPEDATLGIKTPSAGEPVTPTLKPAQLAALLKTCSGPTFRDRRDTALIYVFADGGCRLAEVTRLAVHDVEVRDRILFVAGKGSNRSGPRRRAIPLGVKAARSLDRYLRDRRRHPYHELPALWLGDRNRGVVGQAGITAIIKRRGAEANIEGLHPHVLRHTWASEFRKAGGEEGDLMVLGGWRSRQMLDRYGKVAAEERALASYRTRSLGDRL